MHGGSVAGVVERVVDVGGAIVKGGEHEAQLRGSHHPVLFAVVEFVVRGEVAQGWLCQLHGTDAAQYVIKDLFGGIVHLQVVPAAEGHVVGVVGQQDQVIALHLQRIDDLLIERLHAFLDLQRGVAHGGQQAVLLAVHHLIGTKDHVHKIPSGHAGQRAAEDSQIFFRFLLRKAHQRAVEHGHDFALVVDIAAADAGDGVLVKVEAAADFGNFFAIHNDLLISWPDDRRVF